MLLRYDKPASDWQGALPLGNGCMVAMVYGGTAEEIIQLNEETLWSGQPYEPNNPEALLALPKIQNLLFKGKQREAAALGLENFMAIPLRQQKYQTAGKLNLKFNGHDSPSNYRRELNLDEAIVPVSYSVDSVIKSLNNV
jgi:alpha-L-fucosidase 2